VSAEHEAFGFEFPDRPLDIAYSLPLNIDADLPMLLGQLDGLIVLQCARVTKYKGQFRKSGDRSLVMSQVCMILIV